MSDSFIRPLHRAGRPRIADSATRIDTLVETARTLFLENGYANTSLGLIAREANVATRTIYTKFGGKAGLFEAVVERGRSRYGNIDIDVHDQRTLRQVLLEFSIGLLRLMSEHSVHQLHRIVIAEAQTCPKVAAIFYEMGREQTNACLRAYFSRQDVRPQFLDDVTEESLAGYLLNCICGDENAWLMSTAVRVIGETDIQCRASQGLDLFFHAVLKDRRERDDTRE